MTEVHWVVARPVAREIRIADGGEAAAEIESSFKTSGAPPGSGKPTRPERRNINAPKSEPSGAVRPLREEERISAGGLDCIRESFLG